MTTVIGLKTIGLLAVATVGLSACGGNDASGSSTLGFSSAPTIEQAAAIGELVDQDFERIGSLSRTNAALLPDTGTATLTGPGVVSISQRTSVTSVVDGTTGTITNEDEIVSMLGISRVTLDFEKGTFDGSIKDFAAFDSVEEQIGLAKGSLTISDGVFATDGFGVAASAQVSGGLTAFGETYDVDVPVEGTFRGTNPDAPTTVVKGIILTGEDPVVEGMSLAADISIAGDLDAAANGAFAGR